MSSPTNEDKSHIEAIFGKKARFLVDENLEGTTTELLRALGWNAKGVSELNMLGHEDDDVFAAAWKEDRMIITNDRDFLDDRRFPDQSNPGIIVLPDANVESDIFLRAIRVMLDIFGPLREAYRKTKIIVSNSSIITIFRRNRDTGKIEKQRFRLGKHGDTYEWVDD